MQRATPYFLTIYGKAETPLKYTDPDGKFVAAAARLFSAIANSLAGQWVSNQTSRLGQFVANSPAGQWVSNNAQKAGKIQLHHPIPQYLGGAKDQVLAPLDSAYHQVITNEFRSLWPYKSGLPSASQLQEIITKVFSKYPLPQ